MSNPSGRERSEIVADRLGFRRPVNPSSPPTLRSERPAPAAGDEGDRVAARGRSRLREAIRARRQRVLLDAAMLAAAIGAAVLSAPAADVPLEGVGWLFAYPAIVLALLALWGMYRPRAAGSFLDDARTIIAAAAVSAMAVTFARVLLTDDPHAASQAVREWVFAATYLIAGRGGLHLAEARSWRRGGGYRTLIIGTGHVGHLLAGRLVRHPEIGLRPVGFLDDEPHRTEDGSDIPVLGVKSELESIVAEHGIEHAIIGFSTPSHGEDVTVARRLLGLGVPTSVVPRLYESIPDRVRLERIAGLPLVSVYPANPRGWQFSVKYGLDRILALVGIILVSPILVGSALGVLLTLGRPIIYRQRRVGRDGREFDILKLRTMSSTDSAESSYRAAQDALKGGLAPGGVEGRDRRNRFGALLRNSAIDELPQLFNVLRGEMSLVGPRPERERFVPWYEDAVHRYGDRHRVKSGITGWAQVHGLRGKTSLADRVEWDNYYIENWSLWLDFKILLLTVLAVIRDKAE